MSLTGRYRERKYNTSENDRLLRALSQPVQAWDKQWALHSNSKAFQTYKWVRSERPIEFEEDEESEPEVDMGTTQVRMIFKNGHDTYFLLRYYNSNKRKEQKQMM